MITSESIEVLKVEPASSNNSLIIFALVKFPLWATAICPNLYLLSRGWAFSNLLAPVVEYLTCPIAAFPTRLFKVSGVNTSAVSPIPL